MALPTCDNHPCENPINPIFQRVLTIGGGGPTGDPTRPRVSSRTGYCFCSAECEQDYFNRDTPIPARPTRSLDTLRKMSADRSAKVDVRHVELVKAHTPAKRGLEPMELAHLREQAELEFPLVDAASGLLTGVDGDRGLIAQWTDGYGNVIDECQASDADELNKWWQSSGEKK